MNTPQSIIYNAWKNSEKPIIYETSMARSAKDGDSLPKPKSRNIDERYKINDDEM